MPNLSDQSAQNVAATGENEDAGYAVGGMRLKVGTIVGATDGWWSGVHHFYPSDPEKLSLRGEMVVAVSVRVEAGGAETVAVGREVLGRINEEYYGDTVGSVWERLGMAVEKVCKEGEAGPLAEEEGVPEGDNSEIEVGEINITAGVLWKGNWYVVGNGQGGAVWLCRGGEVGVIFRGGEETWGGSGAAHDGDLMLCGTKRFFDQVGEGVVRAALSMGMVEEAVGMLAPVVGGKQQGEGAAAAVVGFEAVPDYKALPQREEMAGPVVAKTVVEKGVALRGQLNKLGEALGNFRAKFRGRGIYVKSYRPAGLGRRGTFILGVLLLVVLLGSVIVGVRVKHDQEVATGPIGQTEERIAKAKELIDVSPDRASGVLAEARVLAETIGDKNKRAELLGEIDNLSDKASGIWRVSPQPFLDLGLIRDGLAVARSVYADDTWWGLDTGSGRLVKLDAKTKQATVVAGRDKVGEAQLITVVSGKVYVFGKDGIVEIDPKQDKVRTVVTHDRDWGNVVDMASFGGNIYLLDKGAGLIWRYPAIEGGYGAKQRWLETGVKPDLSGATVMAIDGSIWIGIGDGRLLKFTQGSQDSFSLPGLDKPIGEIAGIYTTSDLPNLYLLDKASGRVVVISKKGEYMGQYVSSVLGGASGIAVADSEGKLILVTAGEKVLEIRL